MIKTILLSFIFTLIILSGCTTTGMASTQLNCEADSKCIMNAISNDCQSAVGHTTINAGGNEISTDVTISKGNGTCFFQDISRVNGQRTESTTLLFKNPAAVCGKEPPFNDTGFETTDGQCYRIITIMGSFTGMEE